MLQPREELREVFNRCADKVVAVQEVEHLLLEDLKQVLNAQEMKSYQESFDVQVQNRSNALSDKAFINQIKSQINDGSMGVYYEKGNGSFIYMHMKLIECLNTGNIPETAISQKICAALAHALERAPDYRDDVKKGKLLPLVLK